MEWDAFICHASEDKDSVARPLEDKLSAKGLDIWYDEKKLTVGDSLFDVIKHGLENCRYGIIILSHNIFNKPWVRMEIGTLLKRELDEKVILPVWHNITKEDLEKYALESKYLWEFIIKLSDKIATKTNEGMDKVADDLIKAMDLGNFRDAEFKINYLQLLENYNNDTNLYDNFATELKNKVNIHDKILYLFERIVFDSYIDKSNWWKDRVAEIRTNNRMLNICLSILEEVIRYSESWTNEDQYWANIDKCERNLTILLEEIKIYYPINPIFEIVGYDYLGLARHKLGVHKAKMDGKECIILLEGAKSAFEKVINLADKYEVRVMLWVSYALYNLARVLYSLNQYFPDKELAKLWQTQLNDAIGLRKELYENTNRPAIIKQGLYTEYIHAKLERLKLADRDEDGTLIENGRQAIFDDWVIKTKDKYNIWESEQINLRLAKTVRSTWLELIETEDIYQKVKILKNNIDENGYLIENKQKGIDVNWANELRKKYRNWFSKKYKNKLADITRNIWEKLPDWIKLIEE